MELVRRDKLPDSELGSDRCVEISIVGHGDLAIVVWDGDVDTEVDELANISASKHDFETEQRKKFFFHHGCEVLLFASFVGYYQRMQIPVEEIRDDILSLAQTVTSISANENLYRRTSDAVESALMIAEGFKATRFDINELELECLLIPQPVQPGTVESVGGTGIYTRRAGAGQRLVIASLFSPSQQREALQVRHTTEFCRSDIPLLAKMICDIALGEYLDDINTFVQEIEETLTDDF